jgi:hypothetical protein
MGLAFTILRSAHTVYLCVLCGSENKQPLFPYTALMLRPHRALRYVRYVCFVRYVRYVRYTKWPHWLRFVRDTSLAQDDGGG